MTPTPPQQLSSEWITDLKCPACNKAALFVGKGGYVTCSHLDCPNPDYEKALLQRINEEVIRARVDELKRNRTWMQRLCQYVDEPDAMAEYDDRIAYLESTLTNPLNGDE